MAMTLLKARKLLNGNYRVRVLIDNTKTLTDGTPDPAYVREYGWGPTPSGTTQANYVTALKAETKLLAQASLDSMTEDEGTALPGEGGTL